MLGRAKVFKDLVGKGGEVSSDRVEVLGRALRPFMLRRTKEEVLPDLPPRTEQVLECRMGAKQRRDYDALRKHYQQSILQRVDDEGLGRSGTHVLEGLLRLRQSACHPGLIDKARAGETSAKLDVLLGSLEGLRDEGHKALVFSQFTSLLDIVQTRLVDRGFGFERLDGRTRKRAERVKRFQEDESLTVFLVSLKAGGTGLNLTAADYVFLLDPWWNPAVERQAVDRTHRIGQMRPVMAYRLVCPDTVEERIAELQDRKRDLADAILGKGAFTLRDMSREDLAWLLS
jgi:SNF2 family DNA or RNA helicase